ncbi:hypothetical protein Tsubulata_016590 [Turnera subulata]|uniref:Cystatin domain-containing protein n=1 Tax=Turnera subulata TaxID=218843 RepID=A0A9Q0G4Y4_9ROSI|nr:hypothetical protein Tsubulata_016590 [Turnera subulata]
MVESESKKPSLAEEEEEKEPKYEFQWKDRRYFYENTSEGDGDDEDEDQEEEDDDYHQSSRSPVSSGGDSDHDCFKDDDEREQWARYRKQVGESDGFDLDFTPTIGMIGRFQPIFDFKNDSWVKESLQYALNDNNNNPRRPKLENPEILKVTSTFVAGRNSFITFKATNICTGQSDIYQTAVYYRFTGEPQSVFIFRPKKLDKSFCSTALMFTMLV